MKNLILIYLISLFILQPTESKAINLAQKNPSGQTIDNVRLPRNYRPLYRGLNEKQYSSSRAIEAMLGRSESIVMSPLFYLAEEALAPGADYDEIYQTLPEVDRPDIDSLNLKQKIQKAKAEMRTASEQKKAEQLDFRIKKAEQILNEIFSSLNIDRKYLSYVKTNDRVDFPAGFIYSSTYVDVAKIYSPNILIFDESANPRSVDLNFYNYINNRLWIGSNNLHPDRGEFLSPLYIPAEQVIGYQEARANYHSDWMTWYPLTTDLGVVFMKTKIDDEPVVLVFDGQGLQNIEKVSSRQGDIFCSSISRFNPRYDVSFWSETQCDVKPKIVGAIRACDEGQIKAKKCDFKFLQKLNEFYGTSNSFFDKVLRQTKRMRFTKNGKELKAVFSNDSSFKFNDLSVFKNSEEETGD